MWGLCSEGPDKGKAGRASRAPGEGSWGQPGSECSTKDSLGASSRGCWGAAATAALTGAATSRQPGWPEPGGTPPPRPQDGSWAKVRVPWRQGSSLGRGVCAHAAVSVLHWSLRPAQWKLPVCSAPPSPEHSSAIFGPRDTFFLILEARVAEESGLF